MGQLTIHAGFPKCASSMMQGIVFPALDDVLYLQEPEFQHALHLREFPGGERKRDRILDNLRAKTEAFDGPVVLSSEHLTMPANWIETRDAPATGLLARHEMTELLRRHVPDARILLVVRRQQDWIGSWYQERIKRYETRSLRAVIEAPQFEELFASLHYARVADEYRSVFGQDAVTVVPFEYLRTSPEEFVSKILRAIGVPPRPLDIRPVRSSQSAITVNARRYVNRVLKRVSDATGQRGSVDDRLFRLVKRVFAQDWILVRLLGPYRPCVELPADVRNSIANDNARMASELQIDLGSLQYLLPLERNSA